MRIIRSDGETSDTVSSYCPKCGHHIVAKSFNDPSEVPAPVFDEHGWYHCQFLTCARAACGHKWSEKIIVQSNGRNLC